MSFNDLERSMRKSCWGRFVRKWNKSLQLDKQKHFLLGQLLGTLSLMAVFINDFRKAAIYCFFVLCIAQFISYGLEVYQSTTKDRCVEANDAYATSAGAAMSWVFCVIIVYLVKKYI